MNATLVVSIMLAFVVIVAGGVIYSAIVKRRRDDIAAHLRAEEFVDRQKTAVWASATILNTRGGVITGDLSGVSNWAGYMISLNVQPPEGKSYMTKVTWLVEVGQMSFLQQGHQLSVKIDQQDPKIVYPNAGWAKYVPN